MSHDAVEAGVVVPLTSAESGDASDVLYEWGLDGDGAYDATTEGPTYAYAFDEEGTYRIRVRGTEGLGAKEESEMAELVVLKREPVAAFAFRAESSVVGEFVRFVDESMDPGPDGSMVHVAWDFGDGSYQVGGPSMSSEYLHTYSEAGSYTVTLYVIDSEDVMSSVQRIISVAWSRGPTGAD